MKRVTLKVDEKGRIQLPRGLREELGIKNQVSATVDDGRVMIEPVERIFDRIASEVKFNFKSVEEELPRLRKAAEKKLFEQIS